MYGVQQECGSVRGSDVVLWWCSRVRQAVSTLVCSCVFSVRRGGLRGCMALMDVQGLALGAATCHQRHGGACQGMVVLMDR